MNALRLLIVLCLGLGCFATSVQAQSRDVGRLRNYVIDLESHAGRLEGYAKEFEQTGSRTSDFMIGKFNESVAAFDATWKKAGDFLPTLQGDADAINKLVNRMNEALALRTASIEKAMAALTAADEAMKAAGGIEKIQADMERLDSLGYQYSQFRRELTDVPAEALRLLQQYPQVVAEYGRMEKDYAAFLQQNNADTAALKREMAEVKQRLDDVVPAAREKLGAVFLRAEQEVEEMEAAIAEGERERNPHYFLKNGSVENETEDAKLHLQLLTAIHAETASDLVQRYGQGQKKAEGLKAELKSEIIAANLGYGNGYRGPEREAMVAGARRLFEREHPGETIVDIRVPDVKWDRSTRWYHSVDEWRLIDQSSHQAIVVYEGAAEDGSPEYHMLPIDVTKDHVKGDELRFSPWPRRPVEAMELRMRMLPENFEK